MPGSATSAAEVNNISKHGFWILIDEREHFLPFEEFPWFKRASVEAILRLERPTPGHLYWPELDVDLALDSIEHPERYPSHQDPDTACAPTRRASAPAARDRPGASASR
jgi:Protein of unknown function (DUF2442)